MNVLITLRKKLARKTAVTPKEWETRCNNLASYSALLLGLVPHHDKISCSDKSPKNVARCTRCTLLLANRTGRWSHDLDLKMTIVPREQKGT